MAVAKFSRSRVTSQTIAVLSKAVLIRNDPRKGYPSIETQHGNTMLTSGAGNNKVLGGVSRAGDASNPSLVTLESGARRELNVGRRGLNHFLLDPGTLRRYIY